MDTDLTTPTSTTLTYQCCSQTLDVCRFAYRFKNECTKSYVPNYYGVYTP